MPPITLKRQHEDVHFNDDDIIDNDTCDDSLGNKKSRYLYYNLQSPDLFSHRNDSDETESVYSVLSKSTRVDKFEDNVFATSCSCQTSSQSASQSISNQSSNESELEVTKKFRLQNVDQGYSPDNTDVQETVPVTNISIPIYFKTCLMCKKQNSNPYFQFCYTCFRYRMSFVENKCDPIPKGIKRLKIVRTEERYPPLKSQTSCPSSQGSSSSFGMSGLCLSQDSLIGEFENTKNLCQICFIKPKNGIFNHGKTSHIYCCYTCAKHIWTKTNKCPICNIKVRYVTKSVNV